MDVRCSIRYGVGVGVDVDDVKAPVSVTGPRTVIDAGLLTPEYELDPLPVQLPKLKPVAGVALIETTVPLFFHPLAGLSVPPVPGLIVRKYCVVKFAV